jgi:membrane-associated protease RseP (regulator of RpoE activity)
MLGVVLLIVAILLVVMIHESGHFLVAKLFGFKATRFFLGFGPTLWSTTKGETEYGVKALPLGGFVKIIGMNPYEEVAPEDVPRSYPNKPRWQRALLLVAGSATHWVVAFVLLVVAIMTIGLPTGLSNEVAEVTTTIDGVETPAGELGIEPGDRIVAIGGSQTSSWTEIRRYIRAHAGEQVEFTIEHGDEVRTVTVVLGTAIFDERGDFVEYLPPGDEVDRSKGELIAGFLGVAAEEDYATESLTGAISESGKITWDVTKSSVGAIDNVFLPVFNGELIDALIGGERPSDGAVGLVGVGRIAGATVDEGRYLDLIGLIVGFTIFVGIMNLLPLPPLDGGHLAVLAYGAVTRKEVDVRKLIPIAAAVISFFVLLFLAVLILDIADPIETPF